MVFRLDAVDAYERKLVKQIEVASADVEGGHNKPYVRLLSVSNQRRASSAPRSSSTCSAATSVSREKSPSRMATTSRRSPDARVYAELPDRRDSRRQKVTSSWSCAYLAASTVCASGRLSGMWTATRCKRQMIRRTIQEHLDKELRLAPAGDQGAEPVLHRRGRALPQL